MIDKQQEAIDNLILGYANFRRNHFKQDEFKKLSDFGQAPKALLISCCDSRVDPAILLNCSPGDLFTIRNVANLVPPFLQSGSFHGTSAAIEYGICNINVPNLIILGHSKCGGITSLFSQDNKPTNFIHKWMESAEEVKHTIEHKYTDCDIHKKIDLCSKYSIVKSLDNLLTFPWINAKVKNSELLIHGWYFDIETGIIEAYDQQSKTFSELTICSIA